MKCANIWKCLWVRTKNEWRQHNMQKWQHHIIIIIKAISNSSRIHKGNWKTVFFCYSNGNLLLPRASMCVLYTHSRNLIYFSSHFCLVYIIYSFFLARWWWRRKKLFILPLPRDTMKFTAERWEKWNWLWWWWLR